VSGKYYIGILPPHITVVSADEVPIQPMGLPPSHCNILNESNLGGFTIPDNTNSFLPSFLG